MINPTTMRSEDRNFFLVSIITPLIAWWLFIGRKRYSVKGMK